MSRPYRHPKIGIFWLRKVVPKLLRAIVGKVEMKVSLGTRDANVARQLAGPALSQFEAIISGARDGTTTLSPRDIDALMGSLYAAGLAKHEADPGDTAFWERSSDYYGDLVAGGMHEGRPQFIPDKSILNEAAALVTAQGVIADRATVGIAAERLAEMHWRLGRTLQRRAGGDWGHDANLDRFPTASPRRPSTVTMPAHRPAAKVPFQDLVAGWA